jgi:hypothetical protein
MDAIAKAAGVPAEDVRQGLGLRSNQIELHPILSFKRLTPLASRDCLRVLALDARRIRGIIPVSFSRLPRRTEGQDSNTQWMYHGHGKRPHLIAMGPLEPEDEAGLPMDAEAMGGAAQEARAGPAALTSSGLKKSRLAWFDSFGKIVAGLTALVALVSGGVGLYFIFEPPPPKVEQATFDSQQLLQYGPSVPLNEYFKLVGETPQAAGFSATKLKLYGALGGVYITVPVTLMGLQGSDTTVLWSLYRASDRSPVLNWVNNSVGSIRPPRDTFTRLVELWVPMPERRERYFVVIEILHDGEPLASVPTRMFVGLTPAGNQVSAIPPPVNPEPPPTATQTFTIGSAPPPSETTSTAPPPVTHPAPPPPDYVITPRRLKSPIAPPAVISSTNSRVSSPVNSPASTQTFTVR